MKKIVFVFVICLFSYNCFAQIKALTYYHATAQDLQDILGINTWALYTPEGKKWVVTMENELIAIQPWKILTSLMMNRIRII